MLDCVFFGYERPGFFGAILNFLASKNFLQLSTKNPVGIDQFSRGDDSKYIVLIPVLCPNDKRWMSNNPIDFLPEFVISDINKSKSVVLFDYSNESGDKDILLDVQARLKRRQVKDLTNVIFLSQNRNIMDNDFELKFFNFDFFILLSFLSVYFLLTSDYEKELNIAMLRPFPSRKRLLCLNSTPRHHRILAAAQLHFMNIVDNCFFSFQGLKTKKMSLENISSYSENLNKSSLKYLAPHIEGVLENSPYIVDTKESDGNLLVNTVDTNLYLNSWASLVTESDIDVANKRITEKTFKAFALGHPSFVLGSPYSLDVVKEYGFTTYSDVFDESYDLECDFSKRFQLLFKSLSFYFEKLMSGDKRTLFTSLEISQLNRAWIANGFFNEYQKKYIDPIFEYVNKKI